MISDKYAAFNYSTTGNNSVTSRQRSLLFSFALAMQIEILKIVHRAVTFEAKFNDVEA